MHGTNTLVSKGVELLKGIFSVSPDDNGGERFLQQWSSYQEIIDKAVLSGPLDPRTASAISVIASNVQIVATTRSALEQDFKHTVNDLELKVRGLVVTGDNCESVVMHRRPN